ncbi:MAG: GNAT family N-acetyltransferase [Parasphingorhabdus sp.]|nr:GNAT family N-acetyltransferase [Parasphingorhabdus sp.]
MTGAMQPVPPGQIPTIVTHLEMRERPMTNFVADGPVALEYWPSPDPDEYLSLFRNVGAPWLWTSKLLMDRTALKAAITAPGIEIFRVNIDGQPGQGLVELDFRIDANCEILLFGLVTDQTGKGAGKAVMDATLATAWRPGITRVWLHTCTQDSPSALPFYKRRGFVPYRQEIGLTEDPRTTGLLPQDAAPHCPINL